MYYIFMDVFDCAKPSRQKDQQDQGIRLNGNSFENSNRANRSFMIRFTFCDSHPLKEGSKMPHKQGT